MARVVWLIVGIVTFGALMGLRGEMLSIWQRALVASIAATVLLICMHQYRKPRGPKIIQEAEQDVPPDA
jgi:hypothetical protein